jgi:hypothetical protein
MVSWIDRRINILNKIEGMVKQATLADKEIDKEALISYLGFSDGIARRTMHEYLNTLIIGKKIKEEIVEDLKGNKITILTYPIRDSKEIINIDDVLNQAKEDNSTLS